MHRIAILASGGGSNAARLIAHFRELREREPDLAEVVVVISDRRSAGVHARAAALGVASVWASAKTRDTPGGLLALLREYDATAILLAGYLRLVPSDVVAGFAERLINVHPALLPHFGGAGMYGAHVHAAVHASGARVSGVTIHLADEHYDRGRILFQATVALPSGSSADEIAEAVLRLEHRHYPLVAEAHLRRTAPPGGRP